MTEIERQFTEIKLAVPWGYVAARTYGPSTGEPVLLVHGHLDNAGSFTRLMKYLPMDFFYYVCIDLPGHGWSSHFPSWLMLNFLDYVNTIHFILEALQWKTCTYIGHSMGAQIAFLFSVFQPHRIKKIISLDAMILKPDYPEGTLVTYYKNAFMSLLKINSNVEPVSYTKEEVLHALKTKRVASLNSEAANALFERAVKEVNEKYIYNRDIRLKNNISTPMNMNEYMEFARRFSVPIYVFVASNGLIDRMKDDFKLMMKVINPKIRFDIIYVDGNHDVHNNYPERVAPFICKILNNEYSSSKL